MNRSRISSPVLRVSRPVAAFLLVACFGILFAGCSGPAASDDDAFVFTEDSLTRYRQLADEATASGELLAGSGAVPVKEMQPIGVAAGTGTAAEVSGGDRTLVEAYNAIRMMESGPSNAFLVTNEFLNVRAQPSVTAATVQRLSYGDGVQVLEFLDGMWAKIRTAGGEGYAAHQYLSKVTSAERLADEKKQFDGVYIVNFRFVNMRATPDQKSPKLAEIPGKAILRPLSIENGWAKVQYDGKEGYVATSYLAPFSPNFLVRQERYDLPVLHYRLTPEQGNEVLAVLAQHVKALKAEGYVFITIKDVAELLLLQQKRDARLPEKRILLVLSGITKDNVRTASDVLNAASVNATLFLETQHVGLSGITEKTLLTLLANGLDVQSATHTGDDLRALTAAQTDLELRQSRALLEQHAGRAVFAVLYPEGGSNGRVEEATANAGYLIGIGDDPGRSFDRSKLLRIPSLTVFPSMTSEEVKKYVKGS